MVGSVVLDWFKEKSFFRKFLLIFFVVLVAGFLVPEGRVIPVQGASEKDWNKDSFWYEPWGSSGVHKGVDIFADKGTPLVATTHMVLLFKGNISKGGNIVVGLGPKWRIHYYAHLDSIDSDSGWFSIKGDAVGTLGDSGNALGKQPHLHYSIVSLIPLPWRAELGETQGYKKAFYLNPINYLSKASR